MKELFSSRWENAGKVGGQGGPGLHREVVQHRRHDGAFRVWKTILIGEQYGTGLGVFPEITGREKKPNRSASLLRK